MFKGFRSIAFKHSSISLRKRGGLKWSCLSQVDHHRRNTEDADMDKHRQRFGQVRIGNLLTVHEPEDDQDEEEHQFPMQPALSFDAKEPLCQSKI